LFGSDFQPLGSVTLVCAPVVVLLLEPIARLYLVLIPFFFFFYHYYHPLIQKIGFDPELAI
jgi:hypothetical protein